MIELKLQGKAKVLSKLTKLVAVTKQQLVRDLPGAMEYVQVQADDILKGLEINSGEPRPEHSIHEKWRIGSIESNGTVIGCSLHNDSPHWQAVEYGTPTPITPTHAPQLLFTWHGTPMARYQVAGQPPKAFIQQAQQQSKDAIVQLLSTNLYTRYMGEFA